MIRKGMTIREAAEAWVTTFNAIQQGMIERLMLHDYDDWHEVTIPIAGDQVYVYELPENIETLENEGEIISFDKESKLYSIMLYDGIQISIAEDCFEVKYDASLPMWGTMWSFHDVCDDWWLEKGDGIQTMSKCGFRVYESDEFGYFFGIDGCGYDFYESHWIPLYLARGLRWHDPKAEKAYQMERNGYVLRKLGTKDYWFDGDKCIEEV